MILQDGENPSLIHCRICGRIDVPPYEGYWAVGVCSKPCFDEHQWRETLRILKKPYKVRRNGKTT